MHFVKMNFGLHAVVSEWLRRWTRNPLGSARTGSNPVYSVLFLAAERFLRKRNIMFSGDDIGAYTECTHL